MKSDDLSPDTAIDTTTPFSPKLQSICLLGIFLLMLAYTFQVLSELLVPLFLAFLLHMLLKPIVETLAKWYVPRPLAAALVMAALLGSVGTAIMSLSEPAAEWIEKAPSVFREITIKLAPVSESLEDVTRGIQKVEEITVMDSQGAAEVEVFIKEPGLAEELFVETPKFLVSLGMFLVLLFFLLSSGDSFVRKLVRLAPRLKDKKRAVEIVAAVQQETSYYLLTFSLINLGLGSLVTLGLWLLGMPNPLLWGALVALLNFAPYFGPVISIVIITLAAILSFETIAQAVWVPVLVASLTTLEGQVITPMILGKRLALSPLLVFLSIVFWGWLWGIAGALMAVPMLASFKVVCERVDRLEPVAQLIGQEE